MMLKILFNFVPWLLWGLLCQQANGLDKAVNSSLYKRFVSCSTHHVIQLGDTCWDIKNRYGITLDKVYELNPGIECNTLKVGNRLCVIGSLPPPAPSTCTHSWVVSRGDICYDIANKLEMSLDSLLSLNQGLECDNLKIGQRICTKKSESVERNESFEKNESVEITRKVGFVKRSLSTEKRPKKGCKKFHIVEEGESCWLISRNYGLDLVDFMRLNKNLNCDPLFAGYKVCVENTIPTMSCHVMYNVKSGDTCCKIAKMFSMSVNELLVKNAGLNCDLLQINQTICIEVEPKVASLGDPVENNVTQKVNADPTTTKKNCPVPEMLRCTHYYFPEAEVTCEFIAKSVGLQSVSDLLALNPGMNCNQKKVPGDNICIRIPSLLKCSLYYIGRNHDTEDFVSSAFGLLPNVLTLLNDKKIQTVTPGQLICVQMNVNRS